MASTSQSDIQKLYVAYFNRPADPTGLAYWDRAVATQAGNLDAVSGAFANSAEYRSSFFGMSNAAIIGKIYQNLFGRAAEPAGVTYWSDLLTTGQLTIATIVKNIADGAQLSDRTAITNKVAAASAFTDALRTDAERDGFSGPEAAVKAQAFIATITTDASLAAALQPAALSASVLTVLGAGATNTLTQGIDVLGSSGLNDLYLAPLSGGQNTLQDGDRIVTVVGQGDRDLLRAELGNYADVVVKPDLAYVDVVELNAVAINNRDAEVRVDASRGTSVEAWTSHRSSTDLLIDKVRLPDYTDTREVVVTMRETAAGNNDFTLHFDEFSLIDHGRPDSVLRVSLMDARGATEENSPLGTSPYNGFSFYFNGVMTKVSSTAIDAAQTYDALVAAVAAAVAATPGLERVSVQKGATFEVFAPSGKPATGTEVLLTSSNSNDTFSLGMDAGLTTRPGIVPGPMAAWITTQDNRVSKVSSTIVLDDVGRGGSAGELEVGSVIDRDFVGIERFNIEVRDSSKLQSIESSNDALREVIITNGLTTSHTGADTLNRGNLSVVDADFGFSDVRVIDASAMTGKFSFNAEITSEAIAKYLPGYAGGNTSFVYSGGLNDDSMQVSIDAGVLSGSGRPAYGFSANGGAGNDTITLTMTGAQADWYRLQQGDDNVVLTGGAGHDTVRIIGAIDAIVDLGAGDDTVYATTTSAGDAALHGGAGNDRFVLGTTVGATAAASSNDRLVYAAAEFGSDVVVNFSAGSGFGADQLDFSALGGRGAAFAGAVVSNTNTSITVQVQSSANDSAAEIAALYADGAAASSHVFLAVDGANVAKVYSVADSAAGAVAVTLVGSIDLSATAWGTLTAANFT